MNTCELLNLNQYGFRKTYSTDLALVQFYDKVTKAIAEKKHVIGIFMDLSKAFDTLDHDILLRKLQVYEFEELRSHGLLISYPVGNNM